MTYRSETATQYGGGDEMNNFKEIPLTNGKVALVDSGDYERVVQFKWNARLDKRIGTYYARRHSVQENYKRHTVTMHRFIMGLELGDTRTVDHINHDTLDNRRSNLRIATHAQNCINRKNNRVKSGCRGVSFCNRDKAWIASITVNQKRIFLGYTRNFEEAVALRKNAERVYFGEFVFQE